MNFYFFPPFLRHFCGFYYGFYYSFGCNFYYGFCFDSLTRLDLVDCREDFCFDCCCCFYYDVFSSWVDLHSCFFYKTQNHYSHPYFLLHTAILACHTFYSMSICPPSIW